MAGGSAFPSYLEMRARVPRWAWDVMRAVGLLGAVATIVTLFIAPGAGLSFFWGVFIPLLPLLFFLAPGFWRNVCPLATANQLPRRFGITRGLALGARLREHGVIVAIALFLAIVPARKLLFNDSATGLGILLLGTLLVAFVGGLAYKGKSGWCTSFCPLLPVQRLYGHTPFTVVRNSHCEPCVGCTKNCYDFNPHVAQLADLYDDEPRRAAYRKLFAGAFPGLILAFYSIDDGASAAEVYGQTGLFVLASVGAFYALDALLGTWASGAVVLFGAAALNLFYWFNLPLLADKLTGSSSWWLVWPARALLLAATALWILRTVRKEERFLDEAGAPAPIRLGAGADRALERASSGEKPEVTLLPVDRRVVVEPGSTLLEIAERDELPIEAGCRMGLCGSDPVCIVAGGENLSPAGAEERATLERLGLAENMRMACSARVLGPVTMSLEAVAREQRKLAVVDELEVDPEIRRVVIVGNGIAGITAADYVRRRSPSAHIDVVARERHHLYNRMAITRLIYGRSAMQGLYLMPDSWYDDNRVSCWLNTRAARIDRGERQLLLATGEALSYDRLILTAGSSSFVPPLEGFGMPGTFVLREAEDALRVRSYVQEHGTRKAVVVGGGLLGLEAAYALHKLGQSVTVVVRDRLLDRQLDERGAHYLGRYLEGLGLKIFQPVEAVAAHGDDRLRELELDDGRTLAADLLLVCAGITANVEMAREAGLVVNRGIVVDDFLRSSAPEILAAGDVAEHRGVTQGLWPAAVEQGRIAAVNALGGEERYEGTVPSTILKVPGVDLTSVGRLEPEEGDEAIVLEDMAESRYRKLVVSDGRLVGAILLGYPQEGSRVADAVKSELDLSELLDNLREGDWSVFRDRSDASTRAALAG